MKQAGNEMTDGNKTNFLERISAQMYWQINKETHKEVFN